jgi:SAM-dependent methyltransferase
MNPGDDERARWERRWTERAADAPARAPSRWVLERCLALPDDLSIVDLACGDGRLAVPLARAGRTVVALDVVERAVHAAASRASGEGAHLQGVVADARALPLGAARIDAIVCVSYLDRSLFVEFARLLRPGGWLVYETYTLAHAALVSEGRARGPRDPAHLLAPGELPRLVAPLAVVDRREGLVRDEAGEREVASIVARRER